MGNYKDPLYSTGTFTQHSIITNMEKGSEKEWIGIHV